MHVELIKIKQEQNHIHNKNFPKFNIIHSYFRIMSGRGAKKKLKKILWSLFSVVVIFSFTLREYTSSILRRLMTQSAASDSDEPALRDLSTVFFFFFFFFNSGVSIRLGSKSSLKRRNVPNRATSSFQNSEFRRNSEFGIIQNNSFEKCLSQS